MFSTYTTAPTATHKTAQTVLLEKVASCIVQSAIVQLQAMTAAGFVTVGKHSVYETTIANHEHGVSVLCTAFGYEWSKLLLRELRRLFRREKFDVHEAKVFVKNPIMSVFAQSRIFVCKVIISAMPSRTCIETIDDLSIL